jgi:urease accessory protein
LPPERASSAGISSAAGLRPRASDCDRPDAAGVELFVEGVLVWCERAVLEGGSPALHSGAILAGAPVFGTMIVAGAVIDDALVGRCRTVACVDGESGITRLPRVLVARYRGDYAAGARTYFALLWQVLRPALVGRAAVAPRIWNT